MPHSLIEPIGYLRYSRNPVHARTDDSLPLRENHSNASTRGVMGEEHAILYLALSFLEVLGSAWKLSTNDLLVAETGQTGLGLLVQYFLAC